MITIIVFVIMFVVVVNIVSVILGEYITLLKFVDTDDEGGHFIFVSHERNEKGEA